MLVERESKLLKGANGHITRKDHSAMRPLTPLFLTLALLLCSCRTSLPPSSSPASQEADQGSYRIGVSFPTTSLLFRSAMFQLLEEFDLSEGSVELILCDGENSQEKQNQDLVNLIDDPVDGIILIPYTMEGPLPAIQYANDRGIPVLTLDNRVESSSLSRTIGYVGAEHVTMGEQAARLLISALEEHFPDAAQWNVIYLTGIPNSSGAVDRDKGITQVLSQEPRIRLLGTYNGEFSRLNAESILDDCLNVYPDLHGVICQNDLMAEGCYQALVRRGLAGEVALVGIDGQRSVVEEIAAGGIDGTVIQYPDMALEAVEEICRYLDGEPLSFSNYQQTDIITRENAQWYLDKDLPW